MVTKITNKIGVNMFGLYLGLAITAVVLYITAKIYSDDYKDFFKF